MALTSSRLKPKVIWVRSLVPKLKNSATSAIWLATRAARGISIIVPNLYSNFTPYFFSTSSFTSVAMAF